MIIDLDDRNRIRGTEQCWQLERTRTVKGVVEWRPRKYFLTLDDALRSAAQREIRINPAHGITEAIDACKRVTQKYARVFDSVGNRPTVVK